MLTVPVYAGVSIDCAFLAFYNKNGFILGRVEPGRPPLNNPPVHR